MRTFTYHALISHTLAHMPVHSSIDTSTCVTMHMSSPLKRRGRSVEILVNGHNVEPVKSLLSRRLPRIELIEHADQRCKLVAPAYNHKCCIIWAGMIHKDPILDRRTPIMFAPDTRRG